MAYDNFLLKGKVLSIGDLDEDKFSLSIKLTEGGNGVANTLKVVSYEAGSLEMDEKAIVVLHEGLKKVYDDNDEMNVVLGVRGEVEEDRMHYTANGLVRILE